MTIKRFRYSERTSFAKLRKGLEGYKYAMVLFDQHSFLRRFNIGHEMTFISNDLESLTNLYMKKYYPRFECVLKGDKHHVFRPIYEHEGRDSWDDDVKLFEKIHKYTGTTRGYEEK